MKVHVVVAVWHGLVEVDPRVFADKTKADTACDEQKTEYGIPLDEASDAESDNAVYLFENIEVES